MYDPYADFTKHVLSNGLEVHSLYWDRPWVGVEVVVHSGGREDSASLPGLAHFVEHVASQNIPDQTVNSVKEFFGETGGGINLGSTSYLSTRYGFGVPIEGDTFRKALDTVGSMLFGAIINNGVEHERKVILREFNDKYPFPESFKWKMISKESLFKGHRLQTYNSPIGTQKGILSATTKDLQEFYDKHYVPANTSLIVVGGIQADRLVAELDRSAFGMKKAGVRNPIQEPFQHLLSPTEQLTTVKLSDYSSFKLDRTGYVAKWAFPATIPDQTLRVFNQMLGTILMDEVREKRGLAYDISSGFTYFQDVYEYGINSTIDPKASDLIDPLVHDCISMISLEPLLFEKKRKQCMQRCLMFDSSGKSIADQAAAEVASDHRIISMQEMWDSLERVTFSQMLEIAALLSSDRKHTFITLP